MTTPRHATTNRRSKKVVTTLGELIAAAYAVVGGEGRERVERAATLLSGLAAMRGVSRRLVFVR